MTVTIIRNNLNSFPLSCNDIVDGKAYEDEYGNIYIGNRYNDAIAFSITGQSVISNHKIEDRKLRKINLKIEVV